MPTEISGLRKAAILLIALGTEASSSIVKELPDREIERVTLEVFQTESVPDEMRQTVMEECYEMGVVSRYIQAGGLTYAEEMLRGALGDSRAAEVIDRLSASLRPQQFDFLRETDAFQLANAIQDEQPQAVALVLAHLPPARSAEILARLPQRIQADVAMRIATMERTPPEVVEGVEAVLRKRLSGVMASESRAVGGMGYLVKLLTRADRTTERSVLEYLDTNSPALADELRNKMFVFEDLVQLDNQGLQRLLRDVDGKDLGIALRGATEPLRDTIFRNLSTRAAETLKEEIDTGRPVRPQQIGEAQQRIMATARRLDEAGEILIQRGGDNVGV